MKGGYNFPFPTLLHFLGELLLNAVMTDINRTLLQEVTVFISYEFYLGKVMLFQSATKLDNSLFFLINIYTGASNLAEQKDINQNIKSYTYN